MKEKKNCWEIMDCGREPGGSRASWLGVCPTAMQHSLNGLNSGENGGRICWVQEGTFSPEGTGSCVFLGRYKSCSICPFFNQVKLEEGDMFILLKPGTEKVKAA